MTVQVELYGRLRDAGLGAAVSLELPEGATAFQALEALRAALGPRAALLEGAALATADAVLSGAERLPAAQARLAALPPVCGG